MDLDEIWSKMLKLDENVDLGRTAAFYNGFRTFCGSGRNCDFLELGSWRVQALVDKFRVRYFVYLYIFLYIRTYFKRCAA